MAERRETFASLGDSPPFKAGERMEGNGSGKWRRQGPACKMEGVLVLQERKATGGSIGGFPTLSFPSGRASPLLF